MRRLLACSCLTPILMIPAPLKAETTVAAARTTGIATATANNGARDDVRITSAGTITLTGNNAAALTLNSANKATHQGSIAIKDANDATGILVTAASGEVVSSGSITIDETYAGADDDKDGDVDGPFSKQARNAAIRTTGAFTGNVTSSGTMTVKGSDSAGITLGGPLTGNLSSSGSITVLGDNSVGIRTQGVSGTMKVLGSVTVQGANAVGIAVDGPVGGALVIQNAITSTGYRATTPPSDASKLDADDLLQGGPAVRIAGSVGGGILFDVRPADKDANDKDEDKDGIEDSLEGNAVVTSYGAAPAVLIGSASGALNVGLVGETGYGIVMRGDAIGAGQYKGVDGTAMQIGGTGGTVSIAGGMSVAGNLAGRSDNGNATALRIGAGATLPKLHITGSANSISGGDATRFVRAISIEAGGSLPAITNTGIISATANAEATATAIQDRSNTLALIENTGSIFAGSKKTAVESAVAVDLTGNTVGTTIRQNTVAAGTTAPKITGALLFASGNDALEINAGSVIGTARFGAGSNRLAMTGDGVMQGDVSFGSGADSVTLAGKASLTGAIDFGGGADTLSLAGTSRLSGSFANAGGLGVTMTGGTLDVRNTGAVAIASLNVTGDSTIGVTIDPATRSATRYQVGTASFGQGAKVGVSVASVGSAEGSYLIVKAGSLTGGGNLTTTSTSLPYMFKGSLTANDAAGEVSLTVARKSVAELGLSRTQGQAYDAVFAALDKDAKVAGVFLGIREQASFQDAVQQMLPDHAGGVFETLTRGARTLGGYFADPNAMVAQLGDGLGFWLQQAAWGTSKSRGESAGYRSTGWGASGGVELDSGIGKFGASLSYLNGKAEQRRLDNQVDADQYEAALHWRNNWGGLNAIARVSAAYVSLSGSRRFEGLLGTDKVVRTATGDWNGQLYSAAAGLSYEFRMGRLSLRPGATVDYYRLREDAHAEKGGGDAFNLNVAARTSDELAATGTVAAGYDLTQSADGGFMRLELEGGRREIVGGSLGNTVANFTGGNSFTLTPEDREAGWLGKARLVGGNDAFRAGGEASVQQQNGRAAVGFRVTVSVGF